MRRFLSAVLLAAALTSMTACGGSNTYKLASAPKAVGADGTLEATPYKAEHETKLVFKVSNLAPPGRITPDGKFFLAWGRKDSNAQWGRIGNVVYDEGNRSGIFKASYPELDFEFQVSVEKEDTVASPSSDILFSQHVSGS
jgi:hypothetical protein